MKKIITISFIAGILLTVFCYHAYIVYSLKSSVAQHEIVLQQIVNLINSNTPKK